MSTYILHFWQVYGISECDETALLYSFIDISVWTRHVHFPHESQATPGTWSLTSQLHIVHGFSIVTLSFRVFLRGRSIFK